MKVKPMGMLLMMLAGWINRHQQDVITCLKEEDEILRQKLATCAGRREEAQGVNSLDGVARWADKGVHR